MDICDVQKVNIYFNIFFFYGDFYLIIFILHFTDAKFNFKKYTDNAKGYVEDRAKDYAQQAAKEAAKEYAKNTVSSFTSAFGKK